MASEPPSSPPPPPPMSPPPGPPPPPPDTGAPVERREGPRRLYRSDRERWIAGVAGGLAEYLSADPALIRIGFVALAIVSGGLAILAYLAAWLLIPPAHRAEGGRPAHEGPSGPSAAGVVFGLLLVGIGAIWLLSNLDVELFEWQYVLSGALIAIGAALVVLAGRGGAGGLIVIGILLTVALSGVSAINLQVDGAFGDRLARPRTVAALEDSYSHAFGSMVVDLRDVDFPEGETQLEVSMAFGEVTVRVPDDVAIRVEANALFGEARVFGGETSGVASDRVFVTDRYEEQPRRLHIDLDTAFGSGTVTR